MESEYRPVIDFWFRELHRGNGSRKADDLMNAFARSSAPSWQPHGSVRSITGRHPRAAGSR